MTSKNLEPGSLCVWKIMLYGNDLDLGTLILRLDYAKDVNIAINKGTIDVKDPLTFSQNQSLLL